MTLEQKIKHKLWTERYRPETIDDLVLPDRLRKQLQDFITAGDIPNLMLHSPGGMGKTSTMHVLIKALGAECLEINGSLDTSIEVVRDRIVTFASTVSLTNNGKVKIVACTEADGFSTDAKNSMKNIIEKFSSNIRVIFDTNYIEKMPQPLRSRCVELDFNFDKKEYKSMMIQMLEKACVILDENSIKYNKKDVAELVRNKFPDMRKIVTDLQKASLSGEFVKLEDNPEELFSGLITEIKARNYDGIRDIVKHIPDFDSMILRMYRACDDILDRKYLPQYILILADYQHKSMICLSKEINFLAMITEMLAKGIELK